MNAQLLDRVADVFWPHVTSLSAAQQAAEKQRLEQRLAKHRKRVADLAGRPEGELAEYARRVELKLEDEIKRQTSVDTRLLAVAAQSSVAGALLVSVITFSRHFSSQALPLRVVLSLLVLYMIVQLLRALLASLHGLGRRGYSVPTILDELPELHETVEAAALRRVTCYVECLQDQQETNNEKVTQMAVAHCGLRNFLWATLLFSVFLVFTTLCPTTSDEPYGRVSTSSAFERQCRK